MRIPFSKVECRGNELDYVRQVLESGWLTTAGKAREFERRFAEAVGAKHACAVNSCTAALHLALEAIGVGPGDKVVVPTLTFTASAEIARYLGADPVFVDVEPGTGLMNADILEAALSRTKKVKAVVVVHFGGQAALLESPGRIHESRSPAIPTGDGTSVPGILEVCRRHGVRVVEDAAHAFPTRLNGRMIGSFGDATCFSFYANKTITTGEGGMLVTNDDRIEARVRVMRLHGIDRDIWHRFTNEAGKWEYDVVAPGYKYNMPDINAAIGLAQLERAEWLRRERQRCFAYYLEHLADVDDLDLPVIRGPLDAHSCHLFWVVLNENASVSRNDLIERLARAGIGTSVHYRPLHRMTYYRRRYNLRPQDFPNAERHWRGCISLPVYPSLGETELEYVVQTLRGCLSESAPHKSADELSAPADAERC